MSDEDRLALLNQLSYAEGSDVAMKGGLKTPWDNTNADASKKLGDIVQHDLQKPSDLLKDANKNTKDNNMSTGKDWANTINAVKNDPKLKNLQLVDVERNKETGSLAMTYRDEGANETYVVFKGTGREEWHSDLWGLYSTGTTAQQDALAYVNYVKARYGGRLTVTGHSNGANKAMYATVMSHGAVDECYAFDGQGFGDNFMRMYADDIKRYQARIWAINADNDPVSALMNSIVLPDHIRYIDSDWGLNLSWEDGFGFKDYFRNHSMSSIIDENGNLRGGNGSESKIRQTIREVADFAMRKLNPQESIAFANIVGSLLSQMLGYGVDMEPAFDKALDENAEAVAYLQNSSHFWNFIAFLEQVELPVKNDEFHAFLRLFKDKIKNAHPTSNAGSAPGSDTIGYAVGDSAVRDFSPEKVDEIIGLCERLGQIDAMGHVDWVEYYDIEGLDGDAVDFAVQDARRAWTRVLTGNAEDKRAIAQLFTRARARETECAGKLGAIAGDLTAAQAAIGRVLA